MFSTLCFCSMKQNDNLKIYPVDKKLVHNVSPYLSITNPFPVNLVQ